MNPSDLNLELFQKTTKAKDTKNDSKKYFRQEQK